MKDQPKTTTQALQELVAEYEEILSLVYEALADDYPTEERKKVRDTLASYLSK